MFFPSYLFSKNAGRKIFVFTLATFLLLFSSNCSTIRYYYNRYQTNKEKLTRYKKIGKKKVVRRTSVPPSEAMQLGVPHNSILKYHQEDKALESNVELDLSWMKKYSYASEDNDAYIGDDGRYLGRYKVGNPYYIDGVKYRPHVDDDYKEVGVASWYGNEFHGRKTANGEICDSTAITAAHRTLPLPSIVKVTNLDNGKVSLVRVNDRGPFAKSRIIDLSEGAAHKLEFRNKGTTKVKVEFMKDETEEFLSKLGIEKE